MTAGGLLPNVGVMAHSTIMRSRVGKLVGGAAGALLALTVTAGCNDPAPPPQQQQEQQDGDRPDQQDDQRDGDQQDHRHDDHEDDQGDGEQDDD